MRRRKSPARWRVPVLLLIVVVAAGVLYLRRPVEPAAVDPAANAAADPNVPGTVATADRVVAGLVVDRRTGRPVAGADVTASGVTVTTDLTGRFSLSHADAAPEVTIRAAGYAARTVAAAGELVRIELNPAPVTGRLIDAATERPVAGAAITLGGRTALSAADGSFSVADPPADAALVVTAAGYERARLEGPDRSGSTVRLRPWTARGVYATLFALSSPEIKRGIDQTLADGQLNAVVIDVKGDRAWTLYPSQVPEVAAIGADAVVPVPNIEDIIREYHARGVYVIARIVVFKDDLMARHGPTVGRDVGLRRADGSLWIDLEGQAWVDPTRSEAWEYPIALAKEAALKGFDEIQYDYIRFPTDPGAGNDVDAAVYSRPNNAANRIAAIAGFLRRSDEVLRPTGVAVSIDTFGYTTMREDDTGIGQDLPVLADLVDYISPMVYPSTYAAGLPTDPPISFPEVVSHPYEVVYESTRRLVDRIRGKRAKVRPWLQYFDDYATGQGIPYGVREIRDQVQAVIDAGGSGWLYWDPYNEYEHGPVIVDEIPPPRPTATPASPAASP